MEKFYRKDLSDYSRSKKNANLYKEVYGSYGNMEHLPVSENSSEISMSDLQNMVSSREQYKKAKMVEEFTNTSVKLKEGSFTIIIFLMFSFLTSTIIYNITILK